MAIKHALIYTYKYNHLSVCFLLKSIIIIMFIIIIFIRILIFILYLSPKQIPGGTHSVSSHVLPYFWIHYLYPASLPLITCLNSNATLIVIFLFF